MNNFKNSIENYLAKSHHALQGLNVEEVENALQVVHRAFIEERTIFTLGNGGSAMTASHICCDLNKGVSYGAEKRFKMICLNDNLATLMAYANDVSYEAIFAEPLKNFMKAGDLIIGISGSGNSKNVLNAIDYANTHGGITLGFSGYDGGKLKKMAHHNVHVNYNDMQIVEDIHLMLGHIMMQAFCHPKPSS